MYQPGVVALLRSLGQEVYDFRNPPHGHGGFSWDDIDVNWKSWTPPEWREALQHPLAKEGFSSDLDAMMWADACVMVLPCGRSSCLEAGWFCGAKKPVVAFAPVQQVEPDLMVKLCDDLLVCDDELSEWVRRLQAKEIGGAT